MKEPGELRAGTELIKVTSQERTHGYTVRDNLDIFLWVLGLGNLNCFNYE